MTKQKDRYVYPAIFDYANDGISIMFPDLPGCLTSGESDEEALAMAKEALALHLYGMERDKDSIPTATVVKDIQLATNQALVLVEVWMPPFRDKIKNKAVKKTLTIPKWLNDLAEEHNVNYSHILQEGLRKYLGIDDKSKI
ncbi:MAG: hypothetical protein JWN30_2194 [Bacilli bacterium]|nr:hypothetical protein [Bacilli bacterium]